MVTSQYRSFLLRLWMSNEKGGREWRASLENVETGEKHGFNNLVELWVFLRQSTGIINKTSENGSTSGMQC